MKVEARNGSEGEKRAAGVKRDGEKLVARKRECSRRRTRRRVHAAAASTAIQRLFLACKTVFKGPGTVPEPDDVQLLQLLLDKMRPEHVGLNTDVLFFKAKSIPKRTPRITYSTIYKCDNFSMCIFFLPPRAVIPLHNHPGMTVFSKLLLGSMHIKSYDWINDPASSNSTSSTRLRPARLIVDSDFSAPCNTSILYPTSGGNIHTFTAITPSVVLDVLGPPYTKEDDRDITYYRDYPEMNCSGQVLSHLPSIVHGSCSLANSREYSAVGAADESQGKDHCIGWLEEINISKELKMDGVEYLGPQVIDG